MTVLGDAAVAYARAGWKVIPIFPVAGGVCGCGNPYCPAPGKHPLMRTGRKLSEASSDIRTVTAWWTRWPDANIAVVCGSASGIVVVDCDISDEHDGYAEFMQWAAERGYDVPDTLTQETGSGGRHLLFALPNDGGSIPKNATAWLQDVDIKSDGGYILVAPSTHVTGRSYRWLSAQGTAPALLRDGLLNELRQARSQARSGHGYSGQDQPVYDYRTACLEGPRSGYRDHFFNARAFELRKSGVTEEDAVDDMRRLHELADHPDGDEYPWEAVIMKLKRVWDEVEPDPLPDWDPFGARKEAGITGLREEPPRDKLTDVGNAYRLALRYGDVLRWTPEQGWLVWDGVIWREDSREQVMELAKESVQDMFRDALRETGDKRDQLITWAKQSESRPRIEAMVKLARTQAGIVQTLADFDRDPWLLTVPNGTIDLRTGGIRTHSRDDLITGMSQVAYDPEAWDDRWEKYLLTCTGHDEDLIAYLRRAAGYSLTASTREEALFMLYGPTASGKSTFIAAVQTALGDYAMSTNPENLMVRRGGQGAPRDELAGMRGKRLVASVEPEEGARFAEGLVKQMTGGDRISARHLYRARFEYEPTFKLWIATNAAPRAHDDALFRRIRRVPFPIKLEKEQRDLTLKEEWLKVPETAGAQAVLAWCVRGCLEWQAHGLGTCRVVEEDTFLYHEQQDAMTQFVRAALEVTEEWIQMRAIYDAYTGWCLGVGEKPMTQRSLTVKLEEARYKVDRTGRQVMIYGLRPLNQSWYPAEGLSV